LTLKSFIPAYYEQVLTYKVLQELRKSLSPRQWKKFKRKLRHAENAQGGGN